MNESAAGETASAYDEITYPTHAHAATHPDRLATIATLMGLQPAPVESCRVLELGCGNAMNLISMAASLPGASFVGCDVAARAIAWGQDFCNRLALRNVTLLQRDLRAMAQTQGTFDYIVAHGVYSWVPQEVRDGMLSLIANRLAPHGVAFVSYNVYPGCYARRMAWEILKFHTEPIGDAKARIAEARALIALMNDPANHEQATNLGLRVEFRELAKRTDGSLFHDDLAPINEPLYFHEFVEHAHENGLQFLAEADFHMMGDGGVAPAISHVVAAMDRLSREQYLDFVRGRRFRQTLLCHAQLEPDEHFAPQRLAHLWAIPPRLKGSRGMTLPSVAPEPSAADIDARSLMSAAQDAEAVLREIATAWPRPCAISELAQHVNANANAAHDDKNVPPRLAEILFAAYRAGVVELHSRIPLVAITPGAKPMASELSRAQFAMGAPVTSQWHETVSLDEPWARQLLPLVDGTRDRNALLEALGSEFAADKEEAPAEKLERYLTHFARLALLVG